MSQGPSEYQRAIAADYATREAITRQRHEANVNASLVRRAMLSGLSPGFQIDLQQGFIRLDRHMVDHVDEVLDQARVLLHRHRNDNAALSGASSKAKQFLIGEADLANPEFVDSALFRFALQPNLIAAIAQYLGYVPILTTAEFWCNPNITIQDSLEQPQYRPQLYHLDWADNTIVKVFVHCSDITPSNGPIKILPPDKSRQIADKAGYCYDQKINSSSDISKTNGLYLSDRDMTALEHADDDMASLTGNAGTVYLADTARCFHYGGRNMEAGNERVLAVLMYLRPGALKIETAHRGRPPFAHLVKPEHDLITRLVLGGEP